MRRTSLLCGLFGVVALSPFLTGLGASAPRSQGEASTNPGRRVDVASRTRDDQGRRAVVYRGLRIPVPAGWKVYRLDREPSRCLRYDRRAIYLGSPGDQADCPARLVGVEDVLHVTPVPSGPGRGRGSAGVAAAGLARHTVRPTVDHQVGLLVPEAGVLISGRYAEDPRDLQSLIRSIRPTGASEPPLDAETEEETGEEVAEPAGEQEAWVKGKGFDTCTAPSLTAMRAWRPSFKVSNIYIGGAARGCAQPNLTSAWVKSVRAMGYRLVPTYVGRQAPCTRFKQRFTAQDAALEAEEAAVDAVRQAERLGIPEKQPIYYDMEAYKIGDVSCREAVMTFLESWTVKLKALKYVPGVYGSVGSVVRDLVRAEGVERPTALWFAHWDGKAALYGHPMIPDDLWHPHLRIKQYRGGHKETHGGVTINIDSNQVDGRVY